MANFDSPFDDIQPGELYKDVRTNPIYVPKLRLPDPDMDPLVPIAAGSMMYVIQEQANDSVLRQSLFATAAKNGFNNSHFDRMVKMVVELADIESRKSRLPDEELCDKAADIVGTLYAALEADADRSLERYLSDKQLRMVDDAMRTYDRVTEDIANFYHNGRSRGREDRDYRGRDDSRTRGYRNDRDSGRREPTRGGRGWDAGSGAGRDNNRRGRDGYGPSNTNNQSRTDDTPYHHGRAGRVETDVNKKQESAPKAGTPQKPKLKNLVQQTSTTLLDGYLEPNVYPLIYILGQQVPYWVKKDKIYLNTIFDISHVMENKMEYAEHATDLLLMSRTASVRDATPNNTAAKEAAERLRSAERVEDLLQRLEKQSAEGSPIKTGEPINIILNGFIAPIQEGDYWAPAQSRLAELPGLEAGVEDAVIAYTVATPAQWSVTDPKTGSLMKSMTTARNWDELKALLIALRDPILPIYYWEMLHTAITDHINYYVNVVLNVDVSIGSFIDDLSSLDAEIEKESETIQSLFNGACRDVVDAVANCMRHDLLTEVTGEEWPSDAYSILTLDNVILLPVTTTDLSLACAGEIGVVTEQTIPWLYAALRKVTTEMSTGNAVRYTKLVTSDGGIYYIEPNRLYDGFVITNHCEYTI